MSIVFVLMPIALILGTVFLLSFVFAARIGQFDDLETPPHRILLDDEAIDAPVEKGIRK